MARALIVSFGPICAYFSLGGALRIRSFHFIQMIQFSLLSSNILKPLPAVMDTDNGQYSMRYALARRPRRVRASI
jgi:hypothetical protein